jgi:hypothetical protein
VDSTAAPWAPGPAPGIALQRLYAHPGYPERVYLERWAPGATRPRLGLPGGEEFFILAGALRDEDGVLGAGGWLRYPPGDTGALRSDVGCQLYVRVGGLRGQG